MKYAMMMAAALLFAAPAVAKADDCHGHWERRGERRIWIPERVVVVERPRPCPAPVVVVVPRRVTVIRPVRICR